MSSPTFLGNFSVILFRGKIRKVTSTCKSKRSATVMRSNKQCGNRSLVWYKSNASQQTEVQKPSQLNLQIWVLPHSFVHPLLDATFGASDDHQTRHNETVRLSGPGLQKGSMPFATGWPVRLCALSVCISIKMCCLEFEPHGMPGLLSPVACLPASWRCLQKSQEQESLKPKHLKPQCHFNALINCKNELEAG